MAENNKTVIELGSVIKNRGEYSSNAKYYKDNVVQYQNSAYIVSSVPLVGYLQNVVPTTPNSGWEIFAYGAADVIAKTPRVDVSQSFTDAEKKQVRANIGLGNGDIDNEPTAGSGNLVKSGGVYKETHKLGFLTFGAEIDTLTLSETRDEFINAGTGRISNSNSFAYSEKFFAAKGSVIIVKAKGYQAAVAMISKVVTDNYQYTVLVPSVDSTVREYTYLVKEDGYYAVSYDYDQEHIVSITKNNPSELKSSIEQSVASKIDGTEVNVLELSKTEGKFITSSGSVLSNSDFLYTEKFYAYKNDVIAVRAEGHLTVVAIISKVITEGSAYTPLVISMDSTIRDYKYIVEEDGYYAVSCNKNALFTIVVEKNVPLSFDKRISDVGEEVQDINELVNGVTPTKEQLSLSETQNKFINARTGRISNSNGFAYSEKFFVEAYSTIKIKAKGYLVGIAMISKVVTDNYQYTVLVPSVDSTVREYTYFVEKDGYYAVSYDYNHEHTVTIISGTLDSLVAEVKKDTQRIENLEEEIIFSPSGLMSGIPKIGMIGDSLMSGAAYNPNTGSPEDYPQYAWYQHLKRIYGNTYVKLCKGGMSTRMFITEPNYGLPAALSESNKCNLYIIGLEVNDRSGSGLGPSYLGTVEDIDLEDPDNNGDTYYGNYARIIQKITAFNPIAKFILFTNPRTDGDFNNAIRTISEMFDNCYLVDLWELYSQYYISDGVFHNYMDQSAHYPAMAYAAMSKLLAKAIDKCINENISEFKNIQFSL